MKNLEFLILNTQKNSYTLISEIARGNEGIIYKAQSKLTQEFVALKKQYSLASTEITSIQLLQQQRLNHVVSILDFSQQDCIIVMELADGSFSNLMRNETSSIEKKMSYFLQICKGVEELYKLGLIHRDLKLDNIVYIDLKNGEYQLKLCDTGLMRDNTERLKTMKVGTPYYMPPEQISTKEYNEKVDIWALGMLLYEMICGKTMFNGSSIDEIFENINAAQQFSIETQISKLSCPHGVKELLRNMIFISSKDRISASSIVYALTYQSNNNIKFEDFFSIQFFGIYQRKMYEEQLERQDRERQISEKLNKLNMQFQERLNQLQFSQSSFQSKIKIQEKSIFSCFYATPQLKQYFQDLLTDLQKIQIEQQKQHPKLILYNKQDQIRQVENSISQIELQIDNFKQLNKKLENFHFENSKLKDSLIDTLKKEKARLLDCGEKYLNDFEKIKLTNQQIIFNNIKYIYEATSQKTQYLKKLLQKIQQIQLQRDQSDDLIYIINQDLTQAKFEIETQGNQVNQLTNLLLEAIKEHREEQNVQKEVNKVLESLLQKTQVKDRIENLFNSIASLQQRIQINSQYFQQKEFINQVNECQKLIKQDEQNLYSLEKKCEIAFKTEKLLTFSSLKNKEQEFQKEIDNFLKILEQHEKKIHTLKNQVTQTQLNQQDQDVARNFKQLEFLLQKKIHKHNSSLAYLQGLNCLQLFSILKENSIEKELQILDENLTKYREEYRQAQQDRMLQKQLLEKQGNEIFWEDVHRIKEKYLEQISQSREVYIHELFQQMDYCEKGKSSIKKQTRTDLNQQINKLAKQVESEKSKLQMYQFEIADVRLIYGQYQKNRDKKYCDELKEKFLLHNNSNKFITEEDYEKEWQTEIQNLKQERICFQKCKCYNLLNMLFYLERICKRRENYFNREKKVYEGEIKEINEVKQILEFIQNQKKIFQMLLQQSEYQLQFENTINQAETELKKYVRDQQDKLEKHNQEKLALTLKNQDATTKIQVELLPNFEGNKGKLVQFLWEI